MMSAVGLSNPIAKLLGVGVRLSVDLAEDEDLWGDI